MARSYFLNIKGQIGTIGRRRGCRFGFGNWAYAHINGENESEINQTQTLDDGPGLMSAVRWPDTLPPSKLIQTSVRSRANRRSLVGLWSPRAVSSDEVFRCSDCELTKGKFVKCLILDCPRKTRFDTSQVVRSIDLFLWNFSFIHPQYK